MPQMVHPDGLHRPSPRALDTPAVRVDRASDARAVAEALCRGELHEICDTYATGNRVLQALRAAVAATHPGEAHPERRAYRRALHEAGRHLLAPIEANALALAQAPDIGWLRELYPDQADFLLPFSDVVGLNSAWQWRLRGLEVPVLRRRIHPFYGAYFPTRFDHLELFDDWLRAQPRISRAVDVGVGSGVVTLLLLQHDASHVHATDLNPNALASVKGELARAPRGARVTLELADLLGRAESGAELIVFNPPWLPGEAAGPLDMAIYYPEDLFERLLSEWTGPATEDLFERFFSAARGRLAPTGQVALLFSNLVEQLAPGAAHPVQHELERGGRFRLAQKLTRAVRAGSTRTRRSTAHRQAERVELWLLSPR